VKLVPWGEMDDDERRIASAQMIMLLICVSPLFGLVVALVSLLFGNRMFVTAFAANPKGVLLGIAWVALCLLAGILIGARRAIGGILGLALFGWALVGSWRQGRLFTWDAGLPLLGIVVVARAGSVLGFPFWPKPQAPPPSPIPPSNDDR
jgi:hypothetical protein